MEKGLYGNMPELGYRFAACSYPANVARVLSNGRTYLLPREASFGAKLRYNHLSEDRLPPLTVSKPLEIRFDPEVA